MRTIVRITVMVSAMWATAVAGDRLPAAAPDTGANLPTRVVGVNDLLSVTVYGAPEMSRTARVGTDGLFRLPMLREKIEARGLLPAEVETKIGEVIQREQILVDPVVTVAIAEYGTRPVSVVGAVRHPLTFDAHSKITLLDALARAEGLSPEAGRDILVTRPPVDPGGTPPGEAGVRPMVERVSVKELIEAANPEANLILQGGEEVRVPEAGRVFVVGTVRKPGAYRLDDSGGMSVLKSLALAEGLAPFSAKEAYIYRQNDGGDRQEVVVPLRKIMDRKAGDVVMGPNDILYVAAQQVKSAPPEHFFHFDSWRVNVAPGEWAPAQIYIEEAGANSGGEPGAPRFKAQTRIWAYAAAPANKLDELTKILIENETGLKDQETSKDDSPLESQRKWEKQAEDNLLARFQSGGFLAPPGPVDEVLDTVVNNLIVSANLGIEAHCRVLLTTPIETFSIGHTIVISRGLIDVLPDEASLALVLADELAHIALGHRTPTQFAFHNQTKFGDAELLARARLERTPQEMLESGKKTIEIMRASPYQKMSNAGLFLKALSSRGVALPALLAANIGNQVANAEALSRLAEFAVAAPALDEDKLEQIAALPLGSRVKVNPWDDQVVLVKTKPVSLLSAREKMPFEVTPFVLYLTRIDAVAAR